MFDSGSAAKGHDHEMTRGGGEKGVAAHAPREAEQQMRLVPPAALQTRACSDELTPEGAGRKSQHMFVRGGEERVEVNVSFYSSECTSGAFPL